MHFDFSQEIFDAYVCALCDVGPDMGVKIGKKSWQAEGKDGKKEKLTFEKPYHSTNLKKKKKGLQGYCV